MGKLRINFNDPVYQDLFDNLMQAFRKENGYSAEHYEAHYRGNVIWESELTGWLSAKGYPCLAWSIRNTKNGSDTTQQTLHTGLEMEESLSIFFVMKWL